MKSGSLQYQQYWQSYGFKKILGFYVSGFNKDHLVLSMF